MDAFQEMELATATQRMVAAANRQTVQDELSGSGLPDISRKQVETRILRGGGSGLVSAQRVREEIEAEKTYLAAMGNNGGGRVHLVTEEPERIQAAMDKAFGIEVDSKFRDVKPL